MKVFRIYRKILCHLICNWLYEFFSFSLCVYANCLHVCTNFFYMKDSICAFSLVVFVRERHTCMYEFFYMTDWICAFSLFACIQVSCCYLSLGTNWVFYRGLVACRPKLPTCIYDLSFSLVVYKRELPTCVYGFLFHVSSDVVGVSINFRSLLQNKSLL